MLSVHPHPLLELGALSVVYPRPLSEIQEPDWLSELLLLSAASPLGPVSVALRGAVRDLLRHGGYKPTGRGKPASEYLLRAAEQGQLTPINPAVDVCNVVSLHSGFPISVVDLDRARDPLSVAIAPVGASYVFNASGQSIDLGGLLCLFDAEGPCANAVKDSQRTKTHAETRRVLFLIWGTRTEVARVKVTTAFAAELFQRCGAEVAFLPNESQRPRNA